VQDPGTQNVDRAVAAVFLTLTHSDWNPTPVMLRCPLHCRCSCRRRKRPAISSGDISGDPPCSPVVGADRSAIPTSSGRVPTSSSSLYVNLAFGGELVNHRIPCPGAQHEQRIGRESHAGTDRLAPAVAAYNSYLEKARGGLKRNEVVGCGGC